MATAKATKTPTIEIFPAVSPKLGHYVRIRAANGEILATSECYDGDDHDSKSNARKAARRLKRVVAAAKIVTVKS